MLSSCTRQELLDALSETQRMCAKNRMLALLERRDMAKGEISSRLALDGYPRFAQEYAMEVGKRCQLLDDERFAERFAHSKMALGWGCKRIEHELYKRGIDASQLPGWPDDYVDVESEYDRACEVARRKHVREPNAQAKLARFLVGRGFSYGIALSVAKETLSE